MKKKLSKVLAVVLSLAMVLGLAAVDTTSVGQAAKKLKFTKTGKKAVKSGQKRTLKISGTNAKKATWTVTGTGKQYIKLAKKKGKTNSFTVKANATGTAKVTAKLTKKNKVSVTYTLSCDTEGIAFADDSQNVKVDTGATTTLKLVAVPSNAVCPTATFDVVAVKDDVESKPEDNTVTCAAVEGGVEFAATVEGTYKITATAGTFTATTVVTVADRVAVLQSAKQTVINELELVFDSDCSAVKDTDLVIKNNIGTRINVKSITVDKDDKTKCTVVTLVDMNDGKENTVEYKGTEVKFQASNGEIADLIITPETAPVDTVVPVKCKSLDANGVVLATIKYGDSTQSAYDFLIDIPEGGTVDFTNNAIKMDTIGAKANVTVTYRSGKFDKDMNPIEITKTTVITAVPAGNISTYKEYTYLTTPAEGYSSDTKYSTLLASDKNIGTVKISVDPSASCTLLALVEDDLGFTRVDGLLTQAGYVLSSADDTIATVNGDTVQGVKVGKTFVIVSDSEGKAMFTIPVEVLAAPALKTITVDKTALFLSAGNAKLPSDRASWEGQTGTITVKALDQYGKEYSTVSYDFGKAANVNTNRDAYSTNTITDKGASGEFKVVVKKLDAYDDYKDEAVSSDALRAGKNHTNYYDIKVKDDTFGGELTKRVYVRVSQPKYDNIKDIKLETDAKVDTTLSKDGVNSVLDPDVKLALYDSSGVFVAYDYLPVSKSSIEVRKAGKALENVVIAENGSITTAGGLTVESLDVAGNKVDNYKFICRNYTHDSVIAANKLADKIAVGSYQIKVSNIKLHIPAGVTTVNQHDFELADTTYVSRSALSTDVRVANVNVTDTQAVPVVGQQYKALSSVSDANAVLAQAFRVEVKDAAKNYDPDATEKADYHFSTVEKAFVQNTNSVAYTKMAIYVPYNGKYVKNEVAVSYTVKQQ